MRVRVLGAGIYGCHIASALIAAGHDVEIHEIADRIFAGASGGIPARLHIGAHYPRSQLTRAACGEHHAAFMSVYGDMTRSVPVNLYAVAASDSLMDFGTYCQVLKNEIEFITVEHPAEFGLREVEGAILTGERHIVTDEMAAHFSAYLAGAVKLGVKPADFDESEFDLTVDCTFCARDSANVDRYEPCMTVILEGPTDRAVTIMDGPFPSLYPWNEDRGLSSLTSAKLTPLARCATRAEAEEVLRTAQTPDIEQNAAAMLEQMARFYPAVRDLYRSVGKKLSIRAMPRSGSDARLVDVVRVGLRTLRVRAGKIDAVIHAEHVVKEMMCSL